MKKGTLIFAFILITLFSFGQKQKLTDKISWNDFLTININHSAERQSV